MYLLFDYVQNGDTALLYAAEKGHEEILKLLLQRGANINVVNKVISPTHSQQLSHFISF